MVAHTVSELEALSFAFPESCLHVTVQYYSSRQWRVSNSHAFKKIIFVYVGFSETQGIFIISNLRTYIKVFSNIVKIAIFENWT